MQGATLGGERAPRQTLPVWCPPGPSRWACRVGGRDETRLRVASLKMHVQALWRNYGGRGLGLHHL